MSILDKASLIQIPSGYKNGKLYSVKPNPTYGSELVTNGDFATDSDWTKGTGVTISGGKANWSNTANNIGISQNGILSFGKVYRVEFTISNYSSGSLRVRFPKITERLYANGTYVYYITAENNNLFLQGELQNGNPTFSVDNVSVKEVLNDGDFDFSRSSSATRVNSAGLIEVAQVVSTTELVTNGDFATDSDWTKSSQSTISFGRANILSTDGSYQYIAQTSINYTNTQGKIVKITLDIVEYVSGILKAQFSGGTSYNFPQSVGTHTIYVLNDGTAGTFNLARVAGVTDITIDNVSVKEVIENDVPRLDYSGGASCASLLLEGQSTNLLTYSSDFTQWTIQSGVTATHNTTETLSPDGTNNATKFVGNGTSGVLKSTLVTGVVARSVYLKSVSGTVNVIFKDPIFTVTQKSLSVTTEWQRFDLIEDNTHSSTQGLWIDDIPSSGIYMWGGQLEQGNYLTSYIPTTTAAVTRTADVCNNAGTSATFNSTEGVLFAEMVFSDDNQYKFISLNSGSSANRVALYSNSPTSISVNVRNSSGNQFNANLSIDSTINHKIALKYKENDFALWVDGQERLTDSSGTTFTTSTLSELSFDDGGGGSDFYGKTKQLMTFNEALSDEELSDLTGQVNLSFNNLATFYNYTIL